MPSTAPIPIARWRLGACVVFSPLDALKLAEANPGREVVLFAVDFETTAPGNAMAVAVAAGRGVPNFSILV
ncbi:MAG: hypothetical protein WCG36_06310, partial [bacterium]